MTSASEAEFSGLFHNGKTDVLLCITIKELSFTRPPTPIKQLNPLLKVLLPLLSDKNVQGNGYEILLDEGMVKTKGFICIMETRKPKHEGFIHKTSPTTLP